MSTYFRSSLWLILDKLFRILVTLVSVSFVARGLGIEGFGILNYYISLITIIGVLLGCGTDHYLVRRFPHTNNGELLCFSVILLRLAIALIFIISTGFICLGGLLSIEFFITSLLLIPLSLSSLEVKFTSDSRGSLIASARVISLIISTLGKIIAAWHFNSLIGVLLFHVIESSIVVIILLCRVNKKTWVLSEINRVFRLNKVIIPLSIPFLLNSLLVVAYGKIDLIMLNQLASTKEVGLYSASIRIAEIFSMTVSVVLATYYPVLSRAYKSSESAYKDLFSKAYNYIIIFILLGCLSIYFFGDFTLDLIFGPEFIGVVNILFIHMISVCFSSFRILTGKHFLIVSDTKSLVIRSSAALCINIVANYFLIPSYGSSGAAVSILLANLFTGLVFDLFSVNTRWHFTRKLASLFSFGSYRFLFNESFSRKLHKK